MPRHSSKAPIPESQQSIVPGHVGSLILYVIDYLLDPQCGPFIDNRLSIICYRSTIIDYLYNLARLTFSWSSSLTMALLYSGASGNSPQRQLLKSQGALSATMTNKEYAENVKAAVEKDLKISRFIATFPTPNSS